jgi:energy-coupling factor transporter ATP-binding protein EcfA2
MRITKVEISDFRGFPGPKVYTFDLGPEGKNLLLYGENGSGKSSLSKVLQEFFNLNTKAEGFRSFKNKYSGNDKRSLVSGKTVLHIKGGDQFEWSYFSNRPTDQTLVADACLRKAILDYRSLLRTSFVEGSIEERLFSLTVEVLLRNVPVILSGATVRTLGDYWDRVKETKPRYRYPNMLTNAAVSADRFNAAFQAVLPDIQREMQRVLGYFGDPWLQFELSFPGLILDRDKKDYLNQRLELLVKYRGLRLDNHVLFLNEARLSSIALALYFAAAKLSNPAPQGGMDTSLKILVLDDVLIGLDMGHRIPVLNIVTTEFAEKGWQIFLLTFDRAWYEVAKQYLDDHRWMFHELFSVRVGDHEQPVILNDQDNLDRALSFLSKGEVKAAAVHVRTEFEHVLRSACHGLRLVVRYEPDPRKLAASELWDALKGAGFEFQPSQAVTHDAKGRLQTWHPRKQYVRYIPLGLISRIERTVRWVLNPLNHSQTVERYRKEIEEAIFDVNELRSLVGKAVRGDLKSLSEQRELLLRLLQQRSGTKNNKPPT